MRTDGTKTRERIVEQAAAVFNERGYFATSLADLLTATGLEKGGIYHHFGSKEALAIEAFDHAVGVMAATFGDAFRSSPDAPGRLRGLVDAYVALIEDPPLPGGCPLLNTAVETAHTQPALQQRVREAMDRLLDGTVARVLRSGVERGEIRPDVDVDQMASFLVAAVEGGVMLARLYEDPVHIRRVADQLSALIDTLVPEGA